jgi:hypothetical protein
MRPIVLIIIVFSCITCSDVPKTVELKTSLNIEKNFLDLIGGDAVIAVRENGGPGFLSVSPLIEHLGTGNAPLLVPIQAGIHPHLEVMVMNSLRTTVFYYGTGSVSVLPEYENTLDMEMGMPVLLSASKSQIAISETIKIDAKVSDRYTPYGLDDASAVRFKWLYKPPVGTLVPGETSCRYTAPASAPETPVLISAYFEFGGVRYAGIIKLDIK